MHHPESESQASEDQASEDISANPRGFYKVIKNAIGMVVMFGACLLVCHVFGWMPS